MKDCDHVLSFEHEGAQCRRCRLWIGYREVGIPERLEVRKWPESAQKRFREGENRYWGMSTYGMVGGMDYENGKSVTLDLETSNPVSEKEERNLPDRLQKQRGQWRLVKTRVNHSCYHCKDFIASRNQAYVNGQGRRLTRYICTSCIDEIIPKAPDRVSPAIVLRFRKALAEGKGQPRKLRYPSRCQLCGRELFRNQITTGWRSTFEGKRTYLYAHPECASRADTPIGTFSAGRH